MHFQLRLKVYLKKIVHSSENIKYLYAVTHINKQIVDFSNHKRSYIQLISLTHLRNNIDYMV